MQFYYMYRSETQIGPLNADEFLAHVEQKRVKRDTPVLSPEHTNNQWTTLGALNLAPVKKAAAPLRQQRLAREQEEQRKLELAKAQKEQQKQQAAEAKQREREAFQRQRAKAEAEADAQAEIAQQQRGLIFQPRTFPALEIYKTLLYVIAIGLWCLAVISVLASLLLFFLDMSAGLVSLFSAIVGAVILFLWGIGFAFVAQLISVFTSIESNTHESAFYSRLLYAASMQERGDV